MLYAPGVASFSDELRKHAENAAAILLDGTCYADDEVAPFAGKTAREMGHVSVAGPEGSLAFLSRYAKAQRMYVHINNTNPILSPGHPARTAVEAAGVTIAEDGVELRV